jgi:hypothetical protein
MPELTPQDRESYQRLRAAAETLDSQLCGADIKIAGQKLSQAEEKAQSSLPTLRNLTKEFFTSLLPTENLSSFAKLQAQIEIVGGYLALYKIFTETINKTTNKADINTAYQKLLTEYNPLRASLEAADDDFVDELIPPSSDPLFLGFLEDNTEQKVKTWTQQLMSDQAPALNGGKVQKLVDAWGLAVTKFLEDAQKENTAEDQAVPGESNTIAHFLSIHDQLDGLYSQLSTAVALNN